MVAKLLTLKNYLDKNQQRARWCHQHCLKCELDAQSLSKLIASTCKMLLLDQWLSLWPWLTARDALQCNPGRARTHTHTYSFTNSTYLTVLDGHCSFLFYSSPLKKKNSGHDPLNWFHDPLNWFLDPLMCHDRQFEKHRPDPIPALPPSSTIRKMEGKRGET